MQLLIHVLNIIIKEGGIDSGRASKNIESQIIENVDEEGRSSWNEAWRSFRKINWPLSGRDCDFLYHYWHILAPLIAPHGINDQKLANRLQAPSSEHWFGTDDFGRDIFSRVIYGARISLWVGFFSVLDPLLSGSFLGIVAGYYGKMG